MALDRFKTGPLQILLQLLRGGANRDMIWPLREREAAMSFEDCPAAVAAKVHIVDIESAAGTQNTERFLDIGVAIPAFEVHEDHRAINEIDRSISHGAEIVARQLDEFHIREIAQSLGREPQHVWRDVRPNPAPAVWGEAFAYPANPAADFQDDVAWLNPDMIEKKVTRPNAAGLDRRFVLGPADVQLGTGKRFGKRRPNPFVI